MQDYEDQYLDILDCLINDITPALMTSINTGNFEQELQSILDSLNKDIDSKQSLRFLLIKLVGNLLLNRYKAKTANLNAIETSQDACIKTNDSQLEYIKSLKKILESKRFKKPDSSQKHACYYKGCSKVYGTKSALLVHVKCKHTMESNENQAVPAPNKFVFQNTNIANCEKLFQALSTQHDFNENIHYQQRPIFTENEVNYNQVNKTISEGESIMQKKDKGKSTLDVSTLTNNQCIEQNVLKDIEDRLLDFFKNHQDLENYVEKNKKVSQLQAIVNPSMDQLKFQAIDQPSDNQ